MTDTEMIVELVKELRTEELPDEIINVIKGCVLDYLGVSIAGSYALREKLNAYLDMRPIQSNESTVIGLGRKSSVEDAALLNGISAHFFELDDGSRFGMVHLGAPILSALFAIAEAYSVAPKQFIRAALVGYEVALRLASAIQPGHKKRGFHATGTCGCIGASVAIAIALDFDEQAMMNTISAAAASASGLLEMIEDTSQLKPFNAGKAAQNAISAAFMGKSGFSGPVDPIGGKRGFLRTMADSFNVEWFRREGEMKYAIRGIYKKPYASCRHCHSAVEAALVLSSNLDLDEILKIEVNTYGLAVFGHDHTDIVGVGSAKMSIPYSVAAAICMKTGGMNAMTEEAVNNPVILNLAKKIKVLENKDYSALVPAKRIAEVVIYLSNGNTLRKTVIYPKGEPENPMSDIELRDKFRQMCTYAGKDEKYCTKMFNYVDDLEHSMSLPIQNS